MSTEKCEFCGLNLEGPCETPPPDTCGKALFAAQQQTEPSEPLGDRKGNVRHDAVDRFGEARAQMRRIEQEHDAKSQFQREVEKMGERANRQQAESQLIYQEQVGNGLWQDVSKELHDAIKDGRVRGAVRTVRVTQQAEPGAYHVEHRTNACSEVVDKNGKTFATCAWSTDAAERAQRICDLLNGAKAEPSPFKRYTAFEQAGKEASERTAKLHEYLAKTSGEKSAQQQAEHNQCDGCQSAAPIQNGKHVDENGYAFMVCQRYRYEQAEPGADERAIAYLSPDRKRVHWLIPAPELEPEMAHWVAHWDDLVVRAAQSGQRAGVEEALELIDRKALAGLCQMTHEGARAFLNEIREIAKGNIYKRMKK